MNIPHSAYNFRENPRPVEVENSVVPQRNCQNSVFCDKFSSKFRCSANPDDPPLQIRQWQMETTYPKIAKVFWDFFQAPVHSSCDVLQSL